MIIVSENCVINAQAIKCISIREGHLIVEYIDGTLTEAVFYTQAEATAALKDYISQYDDTKLQWEAECVAPTPTEEEDNV